MKILVVEDTPDLLNTLTTLLTKIGYEVYPAESIFKACELLHSEIPFDIVCTDFNLSHTNPRHNGNLLATYADELGFTEIYLLSSMPDAGDKRLFTRIFDKWNMPEFTTFMQTRLKAHSCEPA